jgi:transposase
VVKKKPHPKELFSLVGHESNTICTRRKPLRKNQLTAETIQGIIRAV